MTIMYYRYNNGGHSRRRANGGGYWGLSPHTFQTETLFELSRVPSQRRENLARIYHKCAYAIQSYFLLSETPMVERLSIISKALGFHPCSGSISKSPLWVEKRTERVEVE